jgi:hypothetical protein
VDLEVRQNAAPAASPAPSEELCVLVGVSAALFYWAEAGQNPSVTSYWDALHYIATSLSVGYANIFPVTPLGKTIGAAIMMVGPALSARALDARPAAATETGGDPQLLAKLDEILIELRRIRSAESA